MSITAILEWKFSPPAYFEEPLEFCRDGCKVTIADGRVEACLDASILDKDPSIPERLQNAVISRFLAAQLINQKTYNLSPNPTITRLEPDGRRTVSVQITGQAMIIVANSADTRILDKDGKVVSDSRQERIAKRNRLAELAERHDSDPLLRRLVRSFDAAMNDLHNELTHLYEIRDALKKKFGNDRAAQCALSISKSQWTRLGKLANDEPLRQGRHRGLHASSLRDATKCELEDARAIARSMVEAYLLYLEKPPRVGG